MAQLTPVAIQGTCDGRFEAVRREFERNFSDRGEVGASVCITVEGKTVVDLWGGVADPATARPWETDTVGVVWSSTKGATSLCAHILVSRGEVDLDAPMAKYWPEFKAAGKEGVTVRMAMAHQAGIPVQREPLPPGAFYDWDLMCSRMAAEEPFWQPGTRNGYHALTFGWLIGEIVHRVSGKSLGKFFQDEVAGPLGLDFWIGLPESVEARVAPILNPPPPDPANLNPFDATAFADPASIPGLVYFNNGGYMAPGEPDSRAAHAAELGAMGGITNGRGLAGMYNPLANGGGGVVSEGAVRRMGRVASATSVDATLLLPTRFALGFMKSMDNRNNAANRDSVIMAEPAFGHSGLGGSLGFADSVARLSFGYTMNQLGPGIGINERGQSLVDAAYRSLGYNVDAIGIWK